MGKIVLDSAEEQDKKSYFKIADNLLLLGKEKKVLAFTSCTRGEGKTSVMFYTALALAEKGKKVLLIDADMKHSKIERYCRMQQMQKGLCHFLSSQCGSDEIICETDQEQLHMIIAGERVPNAVELIKTKRWSDMLLELRNYYDYILIDTTDYGIDKSLAVIAEGCDGMLLVLEEGVLEKRDAKLRVDEIRAFDAPLLGVVMNKVSGKILDRQNDQEKKV